LKTAPDAELQALLAAGADVMARTEEGYTPLHKAAIHGTPAKIKALLISDSHSQPSWGLTFIITSGKSTVILRDPIISFSYQKWKTGHTQTGRSRECSTMSWTPMASN
jgi:ankyrin repeat protein